MKIKEFNESILELNKIYYSIFGYIPVCAEYSCSRIEFIEKLKESIDKGVELDTLVMKMDYHIDE